MPPDLEVGVKPVSHGEDHGGEKEEQVVGGIEEAAVCLFSPLCTPHSS